MFANPFQCFGIVSQSKWQTKHNPIRNNSGRRIVFKGVRENITQSFEDIKIASLKNLAKIVSKRQLVGASKFYS